MFDLGFIRKKGKPRANAVPRTLSEELLAELTGACPLPEEGQDDRRAFGRVCIGTRATLREATENSQPISLLLRDLCVASVGILSDSPVHMGEEYWIYIPKAQDPDDVVALCCLIVRCDPGGFDRSAYVAAASFIEGQPPPLATPAGESSKPPNQMEEEGHRPFVPRPGSTLFLPSADPTTAPAEPEPATKEPNASAPVPEPAPAAPAPTVMQIIARPAPVPQPPINPPAPVCVQPQPKAAAPLEPSTDDHADMILPQEARPIDAAPHVHAGLPTAPSSTGGGITPEQFRKMADTVKPHLAYLRRMMNRMDQQGIRLDDPMRQELQTAYEAVEQLQRRLESNAGEVDKPAAKHSSKTARPKNESVESLILLRRTALLPSIN